MSDQRARLEQLQRDLEEAELSLARFERFATVVMIATLGSLVPMIALVIFIAMVLS